MDYYYDFSIDVGWYDDPLSYHQSGVEWSDQVVGQVYSYLNNSKLDSFGQRNDFSQHRPQQVNNYCRGKSSIENISIPCEDFPP